MLKLTHWLVIMMIAVGATACANDTGSDPGTTTGRATTNLRVENYTGTTVYYLYISPSSSSSWGSDRLGSNVIPPGTAATFRNIPCGINYDVKAEASGHRTMATNFNTYFSCESDMRWQLGG